MNPKRKWLILGIPTVILVTALISYFWHFNGKVSTNPQHWANFGSYINPFIVLCNVSLFIMFSWIVYSYNKSINSPILTFKTEVINGKETWQIINLGNGPA